MPQRSFTGFELVVGEILGMLPVQNFRPRLASNFMLGAAFGMFMLEDHDSDSVDLDRLERYLWWAAGIGWTLTLLFVLGEFRGWWNDAGEIGATVGAVLSGLVTLTALVLNSTKSQVRAVRVGVTDNGRRLGLIHDGVRTLHEDNEQLHEDNEAIHEETERQTEVLTEIRDRL